MCFKSLTWICSARPLSGSTCLESSTSSLRSAFCPPVLADIGKELANQGYDIPPNCFRDVIDPSLSQIRLEELYCKLHGLVTHWAQSI